MKRFNVFCLVFLFMMALLCMLCVWSPPGVTAGENAIMKNTIQEAPATINIFEKSSSGEMPLVGERYMRLSKASEIEKNQNYIIVTCMFPVVGSVSAEKANNYFAYTIENSGMAIGSGGERVCALDKAGKGEALTFV